MSNATALSRKFMPCALLLATMIMSASAAQGATFLGLTYAVVGPYTLKLDLYQPRNPGKPVPCVVWIHGGSWRFGSRTEGQADASALTALGYAVASIDYRFSQQTPWQAQMYDCKAAVRWLRANAAQYNLDPARFVAMGESAGAHLASVLATSAGVGELEGIVGGHTDQSSAVQACVAFFPPTRFLAMTDYHLEPNSSTSQLIGQTLGDIIANQHDPLWAYWVHQCNTADPTYHITADDPPFFIAHGTNDTLVELSQSTLLHEALVNAGRPSTFLLMESTGHSRTPGATQAAFNFIQSTVPAPPVPCFDETGDGTVGLDDLSLVINQWGAIVPPAAPGDINEDGRIALSDIALIVAHWGEVCEPPAP